MSETLSDTVHRELPTMSAERTDDQIHETFDDNQTGVHLVRLGVDVGRTNTDAVVVRNNDIIGFAKCPTTENMTSGVIEAITASLEDAQEKNKAVKLSVFQVNLATIHFVDAIIQRRNLEPVAVVRLGGIFTYSIPPFSGFPDDLKQVINGGVYLADGGYEAAGDTELTPLDIPQLREIIRQIQESSVRDVVISGVFSHKNSSQELQASELFRTHFPECSLTLSNAIVGTPGILERENAAIVNQALKRSCRKTLRALRNALDDLQLSCPFYLVRNDGTLMNTEEAHEHPLFTFASGCINSMLGAAALYGQEHAVVAVADIGGATTDVGLVMQGNPVVAHTDVKVGGVKMKINMAAVHTIGLGGGSVVRNVEGHDGTNSVQVGPDSLVFRLPHEASLPQSHEHTTATDMAVAAGLCSAGPVKDIASIPAGLSSNVVGRAVQQMHRMLERSIDEVKMSPEPIPLILVGGGSVVIDEKSQLDGVSAIIKPPHSQVANAYGAALARVAETVDEVVCLGEESRSLILSKATTRALQAVIERGADPATVKIYECQDTPLPYSPANAIRVKVRAAGDLDLSKQPKGVVWNSMLRKDSTPEQQSRLPSLNLTYNPIGFLDDITAQDCEPEIDAKTGEWILSEWDVECIVIGAGILGCGGGGSPTLGRLRTLQALRSGKRIRVITPSRLVRGMAECERVACVAIMGPPSAELEFLGGPECITAMGTLLESKNDTASYLYTDGVKYQEATSVREEKDLQNSARAAGVAALICVEIGGGNSMEPLVLGADIDLPVLDCDLMGRAFPKLHMCTSSIYGEPLYPVTMANSQGRHVLIKHAESDHHIEDFMRTWGVENGLLSGLCMAHFDRTTIMERAVPHSLSRAWRLGRAVLRARRSNLSPVAAILDYEGGRHIGSGKIKSVEQASSGGFDKGTLIVEGTGKHLGKVYRMEFQNEYLLIRNLSPNEQGKVLACVPDLITVVDTDTGEPTNTDVLRCGQRVCILHLPASSLLRTPEALRVVGPQAFGYAESTDVTYQPFGEMLEHEPVPML